jgi:hypothetical protein
MASGWRASVTKKRGAGAAGYTFPLVLIILAGMAAGGVRLEISAGYGLRRDREEELLFRGRAYMRAIGAFYAQNKRYPRSLDELGGEEEPSKPRYIRQRYKDPMTGRDFLPLQTEDGEITGVISAGGGAPLRKADFDKDFIGFGKAQSYREWKFEWRQQQGS